MPILFHVTNTNRSSVLGTAIRVASNSQERRNGLLSTSELGDGEGLWINPSEAIHTFGMRMTIDVVFLDDQYRVRKLLRCLPPSRVGFCLRAYSVLELPVGTIDRSQTALGDQLSLTRNLEQAAA